MQAEPFVRAALVAVDEAGDPTGVRAILEGALDAAEPLVRLPRPANAKKRVEWAARQIAMAADSPARAYERLSDLLAALFEPLATGRITPIYNEGEAPRRVIPAPEVAAAMPAAQLIDALAPAPRIWARDIAVGAQLDITALLAADDLPRRVLGVRAIPQGSIGRYAATLAAAIAGDSDPLRAEALLICGPAAESTRIKVVAALLPYLENAEGVVRARALDGMRELKLPLGDERLASLLQDPVAVVRAAAARSVIRGPLPAAVDMALISRLSDDDGDVRAAALGAVIRYQAVHGPALVEPLRAIVRRHQDRSSAVADDDATRELSRNAARDAIYLLGRLGAIARDAAIDIAAAMASAVNPQAAGEALALLTRGGAADDRILGALRDGIAGPRSDVARACAMVLESLGVPVPEISVEARVARAAQELASLDPSVLRAGLFEAKRLGTAAASLIPQLRALGERLARVATPASATLLSYTRDALTAAGLPADQLPRPPSRLEPWNGQPPREVEARGAYMIGAGEAALGLWDNATGKRLFVVDGAAVLSFIPGRAEVAVIRIATTPNARGTHDVTWWFERYRVPSGERLASLAIPPAFTHGTPESIAVAGDLATVWCGDYRFHVSLEPGSSGSTDQVIDAAPVLGKKPSSRRRTRTDT